jgi:hypothetical protein
MKRLTRKYLEALEAAQREANPTDLLPRFPEEIAGQYYAPDPLRPTWQFAAMAHNALPALLAELRELRRLTTPEPIGEKHRDGNWWLAYHAGACGWELCYWHKGSWWIDCRPTPYIPTHALPLPGRPEPPAARGEEE